MPYSKNTRPRTTFLFYAVVFYVFASYLWWSYLLSTKNDVAFEYRTEMQQLRYNVKHGLALDATDFFETDEYETIQQEHLRQKWMIRGEGLVFLILLSIGTWSVQRFLNKEIALAMQQNNFLLSITHELKSPLASMKLSLQTLLRRVPMDEKFERLTDNSLHDVDRLESLVDNILFAAKMEGKTYSYRLERIDLSALLLKIILDYALEKGKDYAWEQDIDEGIYADIDPVPFTSVIMNLFENAMKYSAEETTIKASLKQKGKYIELQIMDEGVGIPVTERERVFEKFYRIGNEETRSAKGTGLGLFIVRRVVIEHNGSIKITANNPQGTIFTILLPLPRD